MGAGRVKTALTHEGVMVEGQRGRVNRDWRVVSQSGQSVLSGFHSLLARTHASRPHVAFISPDSRGAGAECVCRTTGARPVLVIAPAESDSRECAHCSMMIFALCRGDRPLKSASPARLPPHRRRVRCGRRATPWATIVLIAPFCAVEGAIKIARYPLRANRPKTANPVLEYAIPSHGSN